MPLTPTHLGPGFFLGAIFLESLNFFAILFGSVLPDIEPFLIVATKKCFFCPHHGFFHSFLGALLGSFFVAFFLFFTKNFWQKISFSFLKREQNFSFPLLFLSSFLSYFVHILFDSFCHQDVFLFWPLKIQPTLIGKKVYFPLSGFFVVLLLVGIFILVSKVYGSRKSN